MANQEHLAILKQGVEVWNQWRQENLDIKPDLSQAILRNEDFCGANFKEVDFTKTDLTKTGLNQASLRGANLKKSCLNETDLSESFLNQAELRWSSLVSANLREADLIEANLIGADFIKANLSDACLWKAQAIETDFSGAVLTGACIDACNFYKANFNGAICEYIFLETNQQKRLPSDRNFEPKEFSKLFLADCSYSRLAVLDQIICRFEKLLNDNPQGNESLFHNFLKENPSLLDLYGIVESEPQFYYPSNEFSPTGKSRLEPDFIIRYPGNRYKLVEIEKPGKQIATKQGHPTSQFTQASWQLGEWEHYIQNYPHLLKEKYPGIPTHRSFMLVIGRRISSEYMELLPKKFPHDEVFTYDDLLNKAKQAHAALVALSI